MKIKSKILMLSSGGTAAMAIILSGMLLYQKGPLDRELTMELDASARQQCAAVAKNVYYMLQVQDASINKKVGQCLNVAGDVLAHFGKITFSNESVTLNVTNQLSKETREARLLKMMVGDTGLDMNSKSDIQSPIVDKVSSLVGGTCTIFQRINETGDMLRICTNVQKPDGTRAVGTFIPATQPDGSPNRW